MKKLLLFMSLALTGQTFAQFSQSFEGATTTPAGWTVITGGDANSWQIVDLSTSYGLQSQNGTNCYSITYGATAHNDFLVTPQFNVAVGSTDKLTFWGRSRDANYPETISVKASTTTATAAAFTTVLAASIAPVSGTNFYKYTIDLASLAGQNVYVGFHSTTTDKFVFDIDNVVLGTTATCVEPVSPLAFSAVSTTSLTLAWTAATPAPAEGYDIYYSSSPIPPTNGTAANLSVGANVVTTPVSGLIAATKYYFYVRSKCSSSSVSVWGHLGVVLTGFEPVAPPYTYGFDNALTYIADGWTGTWSTNATAGNPQAGTQMIFSNNGTTATNRWLFSRPFVLQANSINTITFYVRNFGTAPPNQSLKLTSANTNIAADHTNVVWTSSTLANTSWTQFTATFTPTTTGTYYFGFNHFSPAQGSTVSLALDTFALTSTLSTEDFSAKKFIVYPNPVKDLLTIANELQTIQAVEVYDLNGRLVKNVNNDATRLQISLGDLSSGVYLLKIQTPQGISTQKIVKE